MRFYKPRVFIKLDRVESENNNIRSYEVTNRVDKDDDDNKLNFLLLRIKVRMQLGGIQSSQMNKDCLSDPEK